MSIELIMHTCPEVPLEASNIRADKLAGITRTEIEKLSVQHGNRHQVVADFFTVKGEHSESLVLQGDLSRVKRIGAGMSRGKIRIEGDTGAHLGAGMSGGEIFVDGNAGDWLGAEMSGGLLEIHGNAGHMVGSAYRGSPAGVSGGEIIVHGNAGNEVGCVMRNGLLVIGGNSGDFTGVNMLAGTIIVLGSPGIRTAAGMKRGTVVSMNKVDILPTFKYSCFYKPDFIRLYLLHLRDRGLGIGDEQISGNYARWCGDIVELNRGEILLYHGQ